MSPSKLTKYCACHAKWRPNIWQKFAANSWNVISNVRPIRAWSETVPRMIRDRSRQSATRHATELTFRAPDEHFVLKNTTFRAQAIFPNFTKHCACHEKWHLTFTKYCACHAKLDPRHIWNVIYNARSNKCHPQNSPNIAPATQNDHPTSRRNLRKTAETSFPMRGRSETVPSMIRAWSETVPVSPQPATQQRLLFALRTSILYWKIQHFELRLSFQISPSTAPATKSDTWPSPSTAPATQSLILVTYETSFTMRGATSVTLQTHQILRLPRKMTTQHLAEICGKQLKRHFQCAADPRPFRAWSETVPVSPQPATQQRLLLFALRTSILYWKLQHFALRLSF